MRRVSKGYGNTSGTSGVRDDRRVEDGDYGPENDYFADTNSDGSYYADSFVNYVGDVSDYGDDLNADAVNPTQSLNAQTHDADAQSERSEDDDADLRYEDSVGENAREDTTMMQETLID